MKMFANFLIFFSVFVGLMCIFTCVFSGTMAPRPKKDEIWAMKTRLCDEPSDTEAGIHASRSVEELNVQLHEGIERQHTRVASRQLVSAQT